MQRKWPVHSAKPIAVALSLSALASAQTASADVMEIDFRGPRWVVGGPDQHAEDATVQEEDFTNPGPSHASQALTLVDVLAGPEVWRLRVGELAMKYDISASLLEAVVWQESRWNVSARSSAGARGLAQLMPGTARMMGVDPDDPHANLEGGARYLRMQLDTFDGDLEKALAAYNAGPGRVIEAGGIPDIRETRNYVAAIMARLSAPVRR